MEFETYMKDPKLTVDEHLMILSTMIRAPQEARILLIYLVCWILWLIYVAEHITMSQNA